MSHVACEKKQDNEKTKDDFQFLGVIHVMCDLAATVFYQLPSTTELLFWEFQAKPYTNTPKAGVLRLN